MIKVQFPGVSFNKHPNFYSSQKEYEMQNVATVEKPRKRKEREKKKIWNGQWQKFKKLQIKMLNIFVSYLGENYRFGKK